MSGGLEMSARAEGIRPSAIRRFFDLLENRPDAISLGIGEPDFMTPWPVRDAGIYSLEKGFTKYTPNAGLSVLRREACRYMERRFELSYDPMTQALVTVGGSEGIDLAVRSVINPGDEVIIPQPSFVCYEPVVTLASGVPVPVEMKAENGFRLTKEQLCAAVTERTKMIVLPFPTNPTGGIMEKGDLEEIAGVLRGTGIWVLSDEIYAELTYGTAHVSIASIPDMRERTILIGGLSKSHAMTGWRMGLAYGPPEVIRQMTKIHQYAIMSAPTTSQYAATAALRDGDASVSAMREEYDHRRRLMVDGLRALGLDCFEPGGAFYVFPSIQSTGLSSEDFCEKLLTAENVAVIPGNGFGLGGEGFVRCCYAASVQNLTEALRRMERFLRAL